MSAASNCVKTQRTQQTSADWYLYVSLIRGNGKAITVWMQGGGRETACSYLPTLVWLILNGGVVIATINHELFVPGDAGDRGPAIGPGGFSSFPLQSRLFVNSAFQFPQHLSSHWAILAGGHRSSVSRQRTGSIEGFLGTELLTWRWATVELFLSLFQQPFHSFSQLAFFAFLGAV